MRVMVPAMHARTNACALGGFTAAATTTVAPCYAARWTFAPGKGSDAAALAEWPDETAADQKPRAENLQHQTGSHLALRVSQDDKEGLLGTRGQPVASLKHRMGHFEKSINCHWPLNVFETPILPETRGHFGARLDSSGERSTTNRPKVMRGLKGRGARTLASFGCLEDIAAQPLRYCRLTAHYLHHQSAATPNKEGKNKTKQEK